MKASFGDPTQVKVQACCGCGHFRVDLGAVSVRLSRDTIIELADQLSSLVDGVFRNESVTGSRRTYLRVMPADLKMLD